MKIKALSHPQSSIRSDNFVQKAPRNLDPALHPFARSREYVWALNATKLDRVFASPFIGQLGNGHIDGVYSFAKDPNSLDHFASGSGDGVIKVWSLPDRSEVWKSQAHENIVKGMVWTRDRKLLSASNDKTVKLFDPYTQAAGSAPIATYFCPAGQTSITHHRSLPTFASSSSVISIFDLSRSNTSPMETLTPTSHSTINCIKWNQVETSLLASCDIDRNLIIYDLRTSTQVARSTLNFAGNCLDWSPQEAFNFSIGSEDHNIYQFDTRNLKRAINVLKDHVAAVMSISYSPTGEELVSGSYDRTIRLWRRNEGHSRDIYHTKRMQRVFCTTFTPDSKYILSGSDDGQVRLWRAEASSRSGIKSTRQRQALEYDKALMERYKEMPEIRRIRRHRHVPRAVKKAGEIKREELKSLKRKEENRRKHSKEGTKKRKPEREKMVLGVEE